MSLRAALVPTPAGLALPAGRTRAGTEVAHALLAALLTVATAAIPLLHNPGFYFSDDDQSYFLPGFLEIARLIKAGEWPFLTPRLFQGGAFLAEYQYALFNPVSVALYLIIDGFDRLDRAAAAFALAHIGLLAAGTYALARAIGTPRAPAVLAGLAGATSLCLIYWDATTWTAGLVGTAWLSWAAFLLMRARTDLRLVPAAALAVFLLVTSGWPFADAALLAGAATGALIVLQTGRGLAACLRVGLAIALGFALAAPAWMPLAASFGSTARVGQSFHPHVFQTPIPVLFAVGAPLFPQIWTTFNGIMPVASPPMQYVGWWIPVVLLHGAWSHLRRPAAAGAGVLVAVIFALGFLAIAPGFSQLRWSFRFLPFFQIGCAVIGAWFLSRPGHRWSRMPTAILILVTGIVASFTAVALARPNILFVLTILGVALTVIRLGGPRTRAGLTAIGASHVLLFSVLTLIYPNNGQVPDWRPPVDRAAWRALDPVGAGDAGLLLFDQDLVVLPGEHLRSAGFYTAFPIGNMSLLGRSTAIAGYSPIRAAGFAGFCLERIGESCPEAAARWTQPDPVTGASTLDLARVTRVTAQAGPHAQAFAAAVGADWTRRTSEAATVFERVGPDLPGTLSRLPEGTRVTASQERAQEGRYAIEGPGGRVVWARAWYPGYEAAWNGAPLPIEVVNGILPSVVLPAGTGVLTLRYVPAGLRTGLALAGLALVGIGGLGLWNRRRAA
ncbi:hypothetical protein [Methylobacterium sp. JK268]